MLPRTSRDAPASTKVAYAKAKYDGDVKPSYDVKPTAPKPIAAPVGLTPKALLGAPSRQRQQAFSIKKSSSLPGAKRASPTTIDLINFDDDAVVEKKATSNTVKTNEDFFAQFGL